jgi:RNA polymerase sigma-70 factor (ECF subfamily)
MAEKPEDHKLVLLLQKGDVEAFDSLFELYSPKLYGFSMKYFKNDQDAEELVQEVFVQVWEHRGQLKSEYSFKSYLFTIALNRIRKFFNKRSSSLRYLESLKHDPELGNNELFLDDDYDAMLQKINQLIDQMPPRRREIFTKCKLEGKSAREVAAELNISAGTVDNQVSEALKYIRARISNENATLLLYAALFIY